MPHWLLLEQGLLLPMVWQLPDRQYSPVWQSAFAEQPSLHTPLTHALPLVQSADVEQVGRGEQVPPWQPQDL